MTDYGRRDTADEVRERTMPEYELVAKFENLAEAAYAAMYDARPRNVKDLYDDAQLNYGRAIKVANRLGREDEAARLTQRMKEIEKIFNNQFRAIG